MLRKFVGNIMPSPLLDYRPWASAVFFGGRQAMTRQFVDRRLGLSPNETRYCSLHISRSLLPVSSIMREMDFNEIPFRSLLESVCFARSRKTRTLAGISRLAGKKANMRQAPGEN